MAPPKGHNFNAETCELLPQLIKALTGFADDDENATRCEQFAWNTVRIHRNLSTNSHEVRRLIKGIDEKFRVDNQAEYADHFERMCQELIEHPKCIKHDVVDVQWSVLDFLLRLAYNPTRALRRNMYEINVASSLDESEEEKAVAKELQLIKNELKEDFIPLPDYSATDSDLSDWSDDDEVPKPTKTTTAEQPESSSQHQESADISKFSTFFPGIKPPEKGRHFSAIDSVNSKQNLLENVQHSWWLPEAEHEQVTIRSTKMEANFAQLYHNFLNETSNNLLRRDPPSTVTEYCLMREVLWMFYKPQPCKFFDVDSGCVKMRDNVSIPSLTANSLSIYLNDHFISQIQMMHTLRTFIDTVNKCDNFVPTRTLEFYAANLNLLLTPFQQALLDYEKRLIEQRHADMCTLIQMENEFRVPFRMLECLHNIHQECMLRVKETPAHIISTYLLASLSLYYSIATTPLEANLSQALFLTSVKTFCMIIDTWWTTGRLDDWCSEFLVESNSERSVKLRMFHKDKEKAFFVSAYAAKVISESKFFNLLVEHTLEAGCTLNLLYEFNRISDLAKCSDIDDQLYNDFVEDVVTHVKKLQGHLDDAGSCSSSKTHVSTADPVTQPESDHDVTDDAPTPNESCDTKRLDTAFTTTDEFLLSMFKLTVDDDEPDAAKKKDSESSDVEYDALQLFELFEQSKDMILPLGEIIMTALSRILRTRIASANSFVVQLYVNEFAVLTHFGNIRKVLLLEASDIMHQFYSKLFKQIESSEEWAFPYTLTVQLDDVISTKFSSMASLFRVEINSTLRCKTEKVFEAVDELTVSYKAGRELSYIITEQDLEEYNRVFRLLLKIKWGLITLESLQFPKLHKRRNPYTPFEMVDLLMRRLEQLRFWMMYAVQSIHFHVMAHVLQPMSTQLDEKIVQCSNLKEMQTMHKSYIETICEQCFLRDDLSAIKLGVEQLLNLTFVLRMEWNSCVQFIDHNSSPLATVGDDDAECETDNYLLNSQIDAIELTYIRCHQYMASKLSNELYLRNKSFLSGLSDAFNTSVPH